MVGDINVTVLWSPRTRNFPLFGNQILNVVYSPFGSFESIVVQYFCNFLVISSVNTDDSIGSLKRYTVQ